MQFTVFEGIIYKKRYTTIYCQIILCGIKNKYLRSKNYAIQTKERYL